MPKGGRKEEQAGGAPAWMVTYGDLMGLLLTFFILLAAFSTIDDKKISQAIGSIQGALGVMPRNMMVSPIMQHQSQRQGAARRSMERVARELRTRLQVLGLEKGVEIKFDGAGGLDISLPNAILFDFGKAELKPEAYEIINQLATSLGEVPGKSVEIRGHTDNIPIAAGGLYADNYDLSYHRAKNVMLQMTGPGGIPEQECEVVACGPSQPVADNATEEGRQRNRRVQIKIRGDFSDETTQELQQMIDEMRSREPAPPTDVPERGA